MSEPGPLARGLGFPIHAVLVILPMGALWCATAFDLASRFASEPFTFPRSAFWLCVIGVAGSILSGFVALGTVFRLEPGSPARATAGWHVVVVDAATIAFAASIVLRLGSNYGKPVAAGPLALSLVGSALVLVGAALGARLTYRDRVGGSTG